MAAPERELKAFGMEIDLKALAADDQSYRYYVATGLSTLSERMTALGERVGALAKEVEANRDALIQIDLKGTHGLGELRDRVATHEKWMDDLRKSLVDHSTGCPMIARMGTAEESLQAIAEENAARREMLKGFDELKTKVDALVVAQAENAGAKGQKESDWRTTLILIGMALTTLFSLIGLFKKGIP